MEDMVMDRFDFSPLVRSTIGFDRLARLVDTATHVDSAALSYPPYNIEKTGEDAYRLTMAVAGFSQDDRHRRAGEHAFRDRQGAEGRGERPLSAPRHCPARVRAALQPRRPHQGRRRESRQWLAACRPGARGARGDEAAHDQDHRRRAPAAAGDPAEGGLIGLAERIPP